MQRKKCLICFVGIFIMLLVFVYLLYSSEVITLIAQGDVPVGRNPAAQPYGDNLVVTLRANEHANVDGCEDIKTDVVIRLRLASGEFGYVARGPYTLERKKPMLSILFFNPNRISLSCKGMFLNRNSSESDDQGRK